MEGLHSLWKDVSEPYRETIRAFLVYFQNEVFKYLVHGLMSAKNVQCSFASLVLLFCLLSFSGDSSFLIFLSFFSFQVICMTPNVTYKRLR